VLLGIVASIALTRLMSGLLFAVSARDPLVLSTFAVLLGSSRWWKIMFLRDALRKSIP
jgi:hypothetical protein